MQRGFKGGLVAAVAAAAEDLSAFADPDLAAAPSDMPTTSESGSQTLGHTGKTSTSGRHISVYLEIEPQCVVPGVSSLHVWPAMLAGD